MFTRTTANKPSVKVVFNDEPRRVGSEYFNYNDFNAFCKSLEKLYSTNGMYEDLLQHRYVITYKDSDNDLITVGSTAELQESLRCQQSNGVLRYDIVPNEASMEARTPAPQSVTSTPELAPTVTVVHNPQVEMQPPVVESPKEDPVKQTLPQPQTLEELNVLALECLNHRDYDAARQVYHKAVQLFPNNHVLWYNLACTESLAGELVGAWAALEQSIMAGYRNWAHLLADEDLTNLRAKWECFQHVDRMMRYYGYTPVPDQPKAAETTVPADSTVIETPMVVDEMEVVYEESEDKEPTSAGAAQASQAIVVDDTDDVTAGYQMPSSALSLVPSQWTQEALQLEEMGIPSNVIPALLEQAKGSIATALDKYYGME